MEGVLDGCAVVSDGVVQLGLCLWAWVFGGLAGWEVRDLWGVSWWLCGRVLVVSRVAFTTK